MNENASIAIDRANYHKRYDPLVERYGNAKQQIEEINGHIVSRRAKREHILRFMEELKVLDNLLEGFDEYLWHALIDRMVVNSSTEVTFVFHDGYEIDWQMNIVKAHKVR